MILAPATPPEWTSENAAALKEFLSSTTGIRLQQVIAYNCPPFLDGSDVNRTLVAGGKRAGYEEALAYLNSLVTVQPEQPEQPFSETYPPLEDDSKWDNVLTKPQPPRNKN